MIKIDQKIKELFCENFKDKINEDENYDDYISSFKKEKLEKVYKIVAVMENDNDKLAHILSLSTHPKKVIVEDFKKNIKKIYSTLLKNSNEDILKQTEMFLKLYKSKTMVLNLFDLKFSLHFIEFLNNYNLAKIKYINNQKNLYIYTPLELRNILKDIIKDSTIKKKCKENTNYKNNIHNIISAYGIISIDKFSEIYNAIYEKTNTHTILNKIIINHAFDEEINLAHTDKGYLVYNNGFEDECEALTFYYSLSEKINYKIFTKEEYEELGEGYYHQKYKEYAKLCEYLETEFDMSEEEIYYFDENFILDYMFSYQIDSDIAKKNLSNNLNKEFGKLNINDKSFISSTILSLAKKYPNFNYKGYSYNEIKDK